MAAQMLKQTRTKANCRKTDINKEKTQEFTINN